MKCYTLVDAKTIINDSIMHNHVRNIVLMLVVASMAAACAKSAPSATQSNGPTDMASGPATTSWQPADSVNEYRSSKMGYLIKYPKDFTIDISKDSTIGF